MNALLLLFLSALPAHAEPLTAAFQEANGIVYGMRSGDVERAERSFRSLARAARDLRGALGRVQAAAGRHEATEADVEALAAAARAYEREAASAAHDARQIEGCDEEHCGRSVGGMKDEANDADRAHDALDSDWSYARVTFISEGLQVRGLDDLIGDASGDLRVLTGSVATCR